MQAPPVIILHGKMYTHVTRVGTGGMGSVHKYSRGGVNVAIKFTKNIRDTALEHRAYRNIVRLGCQQYFANYYFGGITDSPILYGGGKRGTVRTEPGSHVKLVYGRGKRGAARTETRPPVKLKSTQRTFPGYPFVAMQLLDTDVLGWSERYIKASWYYKECFKIILRTTMALQCLLTKGLLYNDLKLDNVLLKLDSEGKPISIKLGDVGCVATPGKRPCFTPNFTIFGQGSIITERITLQSFIISLIDVGFRYGGLRVLHTPININTNDTYYDTAFALMYFIAGIVQDFSPLIMFVHTLVRYGDNHNPRTLYKLGYLVLKRLYPEQASYIARVGMMRGNQVPRILQWQKRRSLDLVKASLKGNVEETKRLVNIGAAELESTAEMVASSPVANKEVFNIFKEHLTSESAERIVLNASKKNNTDIVKVAITSVDSSWDEDKMNESLNVAAANGNTELVDLIIERASQLKCHPKYNLFYALKGGNEQIINVWLTKCRGNDTDKCIVHHLRRNKPVTGCRGTPRCNWVDVMKASIKHKKTTWALILFQRFPDSDVVAESAAFHGMEGLVQSIMREQKSVRTGIGGVGGVGGIGGIGGIGGGERVDIMQEMMMGALRGGQLAIVRILEPNVRIDNDDAIAEATENETQGNFEVVKYLIGKEGVDLKDAALHAIQSGTLKMFKFILNKISSGEKDDDFWHDAIQRTGTNKSAENMLKGMLGDAKFHQLNSRS